MSVTDNYLNNNRIYSASFTGAPPPPLDISVAVLACMDARLDVYRALGITEGESHVLRNAGGVVTDDAIRSLAISQYLLGTRKIILVHHTDCGILTFTDDQLTDTLASQTGQRPTWTAESFTSLHDNIRQSLTRITDSPFIPYKGASAVSSSTWPPADSRKSSPPSQPPQGRPDAHAQAAPAPLKMGTGGSEADRWAGVERLHVHTQLIELATLHRIPGVDRVWKHCRRPESGVGPAQVTDKIDDRALTRCCRLLVVTVLWWRPWVLCGVRAPACQPELHSRQVRCAPHVVVCDCPGCNRMRWLPVWKALGGQVMGSVPSPVRRRCGARVSAV